MQAMTPIKDVLCGMAAPLAMAALLLPTAYLLPAVDLTGPVALAAYWISESGGTIGTPILCLCLALLIVGRDGLTWTQRGGELSVIILAPAVLFGGAAYLNEYVVKPSFAVPRPNIVGLAKTSALGISVDAFYAIPTKQRRSEYLTTVLTPNVDPPMAELIRSHWIHETGYSFPSGHSFSAMLVATVFLGLGLTQFSGKRVWVFYGLVSWAIAVCLSRPILRVHSATDIFVSGLEGIILGVVAFTLVYSILEKFAYGAEQLNDGTSG